MSDEALNILIFMIPIISLVLLGVVLIIVLWLLFKSFQGGSVGIKLSLDNLEKFLDRLNRELKDEFSRNRDEFNKNAKENREEMAKSLERFSESVLQILKSFEDRMTRTVNDLNQVQKEKFDTLTQMTEQKLEKVRETVDEKLHQTLEQRLGQSFKLVSERLELVHKGLGEMQTIASGVGDLKKVLTNVKTRGVLGEYQLENILEQLLTPDQYAKNIKTKPGSNTFVEFAIKLPGKDDWNRPLWLPLDAKFPTEDYQALMEESQSDRLEEIRQRLVVRLKSFARDIRDKYVDPPHTTDFAILFLPFEGLYAEITRLPGLWELLQREFKVTVVGPTTFSAFLNSLQMGFRTLAIEKRSSEVWELLGAVKSEFGKFGEILQKTKEKLDQASNAIESAGVRSRAIERRLRDVQQLPAGQESELLEANFQDQERTNLGE